MAGLVAAAGRRPDVSIHDGYLPPEKVTGLTAVSDCYISLHRSEGFGLTIAEALALGKPTIATGYSGNLTFMDAKGSYLVPNRLSPVPKEPVRTRPAHSGRTRISRLRRR